MTEVFPAEWLKICPDCEHRATGDGEFCAPCRSIRRRAWREGVTTPGLWPIVQTKVWSLWAFVEAPPFAPGDTVEQRAPVLLHLLERLGELAHHAVGALTESTKTRV